MDLIGAGVLLIVTGALTAMLTWVSWTHAQYAGLWWCGAGIAIALDGAITLAQMPTFLLPFASDAIGPTAAWLFYRGACVYANRPPRLIAAYGAAMATAAWFVLHYLGPAGSTFYASACAEIPLVTFSGLLVYRAADSTMSRFFAGSFVFPLVLVILNPTLKNAGISPQISALLWVAAMSPLVLFAISVFLERGLAEKNRVLAKQSAELRKYRSDLERLVESKTQELALSQQRLHHSERLASIGTLTAGLAHQVNNPVGSIMAAAGFAKHCREADDELETLRKAVEDIEHEAARCGEIVRDMLRFASDRPTDKKVVPIESILERAGHAVRRLARERGATVEIDAPAPCIPVLASAIELEQALTNVVENAIQSRPRGAQVRITRRLVGSGEVRIEVLDDGCGIAEDELDQVLDPFFTSRLEAGGTGLGLSVAHGIIQEHGGRITIDSEPGKGTTVALTLPQAG